MIYLDNAATTKPEKEVVDAMIPYFTDKWYNPSSLYGKSKEIKNDIESVKLSVANFINCDINEIFFTSGGSESNSWAIQGWINANSNDYKTIITTNIEHSSIIECLEDNRNEFLDVEYIGCNKEGFLNLFEFEEALAEAQKWNKKIFVSVQFANNEIGTIQNIKKISQLTHKYNGVFHTDAVQAFGQIYIDVKDLGIDLMSVSGHKIGTPKGIGILYINLNVEISPLIYGHQNFGMRGGTENVPYIISFGKAIEILQRDFVETQMKLTMLRNNFIAKLKSFNCEINGSLDKRLPNNINITFNQNITGESLVYGFDMSGIFISTGSACNSNSIKPSYVLKAIGLSNENANKTIRITLSKYITMDDIDLFVDELKRQIKLLTC